MGPLDAIAHRSRWSQRGLGGTLALVFGLMAVALGWPGPAGGLAAGAVACAVACGLARVPGAALLGFLAAPAGFLLTSLPLLALSVPESWAAGALRWSPAGVDQAVALAARTLGASCCLALLTLTTPAPRLLAGLESLGVPLWLCDLMLLIYRLVFVIGGLALSGQRAQAARLGYRSVSLSLRSLSLLVSGLLGRALHRAHRLDIGLRARGYEGRLTVLSPPTPTLAADWALAVGAVAVAVGLAFVLVLGGQTV